MRPFFYLLGCKNVTATGFPASAGKRHKAAISSRRLDSGDRGMGSEALETLPVVRCPGCEEPMQPKGVAPVTRELDDISYVCPKCGAETKRTMKRV
jgi:hypothetical protein